MTLNRRFKPAIMREFSIQDCNGFIITFAEWIGVKGFFENLVYHKELVSIKNKEPIILLDGVHYLLTRFSFDKFIEALYQINEIVIKNKSILFIRFDPSLVNTNQIAIIENELQLLPSQNTRSRYPNYFFVIVFGS